MYKSKRNIRTSHLSKSIKSEQFHDVFNVKVMRFNDVIFSRKEVTEIKDNIYTTFSCDVIFPRKGNRNKRQYVHNNFMYVRI